MPHHRTVLGDLPDSCLLQVFKHLSPLPDKFSVGATCWVSVQSSQPTSGTHGRCPRHTCQSEPSLTLPLSLRLLLPACLLAAVLAPGQ